MHVLVLGAGLSGVTTAWYLTRAASRSAVVGPARTRDQLRQRRADLDQSRAWANLWRACAGAALARTRDAPLKFRPRRPAQWTWGLRFPARMPAGARGRNTVAIAALALASAQRLRALRADSDLEYDQLEAASCTCSAAARSSPRPRARRTAARLRHRRRVLDRGPASRRESGAGGLRRQPCRADLRAGDESGDAHQTFALATGLPEAGVALHWGPR